MVRWQFHWLPVSSLFFYPYNQPALLLLLMLSAAVTITTNDRPGACPDLLADTFNEAVFTARCLIVALRKSYQPLSLVYGLFARPDLSEEQRRGLVASTGKDLPTRLPDWTIKARIGELRDLVARASARGTTTPIFFEMPIEPALERVARVTQVHEAAHAAFPSGAYFWIPLKLRGGARTPERTLMGRERCMRHRGGLAISKRIRCAVR